MIQLIWIDVINSIGLEKTWKFTNERTAVEL